MRPEPGGLFSRGLKAIAWRIRKALGDQRVDRALVKAARFWRPMPKRAVFIGITGSAGKTTTKELLLGVLSRKARGIANTASLNVLPEVAKTILRLRPSHSFCVAELSEDRPGVMDDKLALLQPSIAIVTVVQDDHLAAFDSRDALFGEMAKLVLALPASGTAVLNADDERVLAMAAHCAAKLITFGISPKADLRAEDISSVWPDRLQLSLVRGPERVRLVTQLCGTHWIPSVLGAIGAGLAAGMTLDACFDFMKSAKARRKIVVIGEVSDIGPAKALKYARIATRALETVDLVVFVGPWASSALRARPSGREGALRAFGQVRDAAEFINSITREGDLVLLKGTGKQDHLLRIILAREEGMACWRDDCQRPVFCNVCPERMTPSGVPILNLQRTRSPLASQNPPDPAISISATEQVIVGLGNPGAQYANTPHNVGYEVVDQLAIFLGLTWNQMPQAWTARGLSHGQPVCLVKVQMAMNLTGAGLKRLAETMAFSPERCILVFDDLDLPLGIVKTRLGGSAGGHRGVASVLEAFQSDAFRRVKVGVSPIGTPVNRVEFVLRPFGAANRTILEPAITAAQTRVIEMIIG